MSNKANLEIIKELSAGVSMQLLAQIFSLSPRAVAVRLRDLSASGERAGKPVYNFAEASRYLVDPVIDIQAYISALKPEDLPVKLQAAYWNAQIRRQEWEEKAKMLWRTPDVLQVFLDVFKKTRQTILLFSDTIDKSIGLTQDQQRALVQMSDALIDDIRVKLTEEFELYAALNLHAQTVMDQQAEEEEIAEQKRVAALKLEEGEIPDESEEEEPDEHGF